jgi:hypothetical protein
MGLKRFTSIWPEFEYAMEPPDAQSEAGRHVPGELAGEVRVKSEAEVSLGLTPVAAMAETSRCLRCDIRGSER